MQGLQAEASSLFGGSGEPQTDEQLVARIRSQLGRVCSHPRALQVESHGGRVTLRGPVLAAEAQRVFDCVRSVRGVQSVDNQMEQHQEAGNISALQGGTRRPGAQWDLFQESWSPATRLLVGAGAASLFSMGLTRTVLGGALGAVALGMATGRVSAGSSGSPRRRQRSLSGGQSGRTAQRFGSMASGGLSDRGGYNFGEDRDLRVSSLMTPSPMTCKRSNTLQEAARMMLECDCGAIPVVDDGAKEPLGIITDRDITIRAVAEGRNPREAKVSECMTSPVETISSEASLDECLDKMESAQLRRMIVVDEDNRVAGIIAQADIAMYAPLEETAELVQDVSTPSPAPTI
jgi:CBS domain-containing protein